MFDDPNKELRRLEEELWLSEDAEEEPEMPPLEELFEYEDSDWLEDTRALIDDGEDIPIRNHANNYGRGRGSGVRNMGRTVYTEQEMDENAAVFVEKRKKNRKKGVGCLPLVLLLEVLGIAFVCWWWYRWLR